MKASLNLGELAASVGDPVVRNSSFWFKLLDLHSETPRPQSQSDPMDLVTIGGLGLERTLSPLIMG